MSLFDYPRLNETGRAKADAIADAFKSLAGAIEQSTLPGRARALAITKLQEAAQHVFAALGEAPANVCACEGGHP